MDNLSNIETVFLSALEKGSAEDRTAFLDKACQGDPDLRQSVERLLQAHPQVGSFLQSPLLARMAENLPNREGPGSMVGPYKLLEKIGEGGMGTVYMAQQEEPIRRLVAVKIIKPGLDSAEVLARFEAERQALALMDHPNVAKVLDAGTTASGLPYFVMELIHGIPITDYCNQRRLSPRERLELFIPVCQAVQHAHQKGVIHRDLKPSNVLVALYDGKPVPKVIDFGVAKAVGQKLTERTLATNFGGLVGTFEYMSPEQAELNQIDIDTRSDVYTLGVLLYELLTGQTPLDRKRLQEAGLLEIARRVREEEPPTPSVRLSSSPDLPTLSEQRGLEPARLARLVRGELDWIVMKALEKDRTLRYQTASSLARDVQHYLADEQVEAIPPSMLYRLRKLLKRNKGPVLAAALIVSALLAGMAGTTWGLIEARWQRDLAEQAWQSEEKRAEAERLAKVEAEAGEKLAGERLVQVNAEKKKTEQAKLKAEAGEKLAAERLIQVDAEKKKAEEEKLIARSVLNFLENKLLRQAETRIQADDLLLNGGRSAEAKPNPTIRELLDRAAKELVPERIEASFPNQPRVQAELLHAVGRTYIGVGEYERAIAFLQRAADLYRQHLGPDHPETLVAMSSLSEAYHNVGKPERALQLMEESFKHYKGAPGPAGEGTIALMTTLA